MAEHFAKIAVLGRPQDPRVTEPITTLVGHLNNAGREVFAADELTIDLPVTRVPESGLAARVELMIAVGGDGTMLYAAHLAMGENVPLLGINRGRLGFLADVTPDEMLASVDKVLAGDYACDSRLLLEARLEVKGGGKGDDKRDKPIIGTALNDVVLQRRETGRMVDFETLVDGDYVNTHSGDGLIVATPTGSTAYSLSCGGPIIEPQLDAVALVPVAPHTLSDRPIVIPASQRIDVRLLARDDTKAEITVDGHPLGEIRPDDRLTIRAAPHRMTLIHPPGYNYYGILRSKLYWGRDSRNRAGPPRAS